MKKAAFIILIVLSISCLVWAQRITVTSPNGGETLVLGKTWQIAWTVVNVTGKVKIVLIKSNGAIIGLIETNLAAAGSPYPWTIGQTKSGMAGAGDYKIRVIALSGNQQDTSDSRFTIAAAATSPVVIQKELPILQLPGLKFPRIEVSNIDVAPNVDGFGITFSYKNAGNCSWPKASDTPDRPDYNVVGQDDGRNYAQGVLYIPPFPAEPGWEQVGYFGGMVTLPTLGTLVHGTGANSLYYEHAYSLYGWHVSEKVKVLINGYKRMGMDSHELTKGLKQMVLDSGRMYDLLITTIFYDWNTYRLQIGVRLDGEIPKNETFDLMCYNDYAPDKPALIYLTKQPMNKRGYYFQAQLTKMDALQIAKFIVFVVCNVDKPQQRIGDVDMRNNMRFQETRRPE